MASTNFPVFFKDSILQQQISTKGFVKVYQLVQPNEIQELSEMFVKTSPPEIHGMYSNVFNNPYEVNVRIDALMRKIFLPLMDEYLVDCDYTGGVFLAKGTTDKSVSYLHQDWNNVDENLSASFNFWCPLVDVDETNGALQCIAGSHSLFQTIRSINHPSVFLEFSPAIEPYLTAVDAKKGDVIFYLHNVFHGSKPNYTDVVRPAVAMGVKPKNAQQIHYMKNEEGLIEMFEIDYREFFFRTIYEYNQGKPLTLKNKIGVAANNQPEFDESTLIARLKELPEGLNFPQ